MLSTAQNATMATDDSTGHNGSGPKIMRAASIDKLMSAIGRPILWIVLMIVSVIPTLAFLILAISPRLFDQGVSYFSLSAFQQAFSGSEIIGVRNSLIIASLASVLASIFAGGLAWIAQRTDLAGGKWIGIILWWVLLVPTYVVSVGWEEVLGPSSLFSQLGIVSPLMRNTFIGPLGVVLVLAYSGTPFAYFAMAPAIAGMGRRYEEAARTHGAGRRKTFITVFPIIIPALFAALTIVFAEALGDFGVAATLATTANLPVATTGIMNAIATFPTNFGEAAAIGWMLVGTLGVVLTIQNKIIRKRNYAALSGRSTFAPKQHLAGFKRFAGYLFFYGFFAFTIVIPALGAVMSTLLKPYSTLKLSNFTLDAYTSLISTQSLGAPILVSLKMAVINATLTVIVGISIAKVISSPRAGITGRLTDVIIVGSVALPAIVLSAGFIFVFNLPFTIHMGINIYGTLILLGIGYLAIALPSNSRLLLGPVSQLDGSLMRAGRVHGAGLSRSFVKCILPLLAKSIVWAWLLTFAATFGELPTSQMLAPTGVRTMATAVLNSFQSANLSAATAFSVVQMLIVLAVITVVLTLFHFVAPPGWRNIAPESAKR